jgi:hypothetical protein
MARSPRQRVLAIALLSVVLALAAACGSSSSSGGGSGGGGGGGGGVATLSDSSFCNLAKKWNKQQSKQLTTLTNLSDPAGMKAFYTTLSKDYQSVIAVAPGDIKPSLEVLYGDFNQLTSILAKHDYDIQKAAPDLASVEGIFSSAKTKAALAKLDAWGKANNCHV